MADDPIKKSGDHFLDAPLEEYVPKVASVGTFSTQFDVAKFAAAKKAYTKKGHSAQAKFTPNPGMVLPDADFVKPEDDSPKWKYKAWAANVLHKDAFAIYVTRKCGPFRESGQLTAEGITWTAYNAFTEIPPFFLVDGHVQHENTNWHAVKEMARLIWRTQDMHDIHAVKLEG